jgi:hypothetical protein
VATPPAQDPLWIIAAICGIWRQVGRGPCLPEEH